MARIALQQYLRHIDTLLDENRFSEAIAHCRHILQQYPRHVDSYRLLGKALLEQGSHDDAADIFQRVLSADPEDFVAHAGLAIVHKEKNNLPASIWHMERAFEMDPYNGAVQGELKELYGRRDAAYPSRVSLTRGALAHLYVRGGLYQQATTELRQLLTEEPDRIDLHMLLAESLWRDEQRVDAVGICLNVLDKMPNCVKANAILAEVWVMSGRHDEAQEYLQRLRGLTQLDKRNYDAETAIGRAFAANGVVDLPEQVSLEELDYVPGLGPGEETPDWVRELGLAEGTPEGVVEDVPAWLREMGDQGENPFASEAVAGEEDTLDWLRQAADPGPAGETAFPQTAAEMDSFFGSGPGFSEAAATGTEADWFSDVQPAASAGAEDRGVPDWFVSHEPGDDVPDWMADLAGSPSKAAGRPAADSAAQPDWLSAMTGDEDEFEGFDFEAIQAAASGDWMSEANAEELETPDPTRWSDFLDKGETVRPQEPVHNLEEAEWPHWIQDIEHPEVAALPDWMQAEDEEQAAGDDNLADWLTEAKPTLTSTSDVETLDWMQPGNQAADTTSPTTAAQPAGEAEWPDWLNEIETESVPSVLPERPATRIAASGVASASEAASEASEYELPSWLEELAPAEGQPATSLPSWLDELAPAESQPGVAEATTAEADDGWLDWLSEAEADMAVAAPLAWLETNEEPAGEIGLTKADLTEASLTEAGLTEAGLTESGMPDWLRELEHTKQATGTLKLGESELSPADEAWPDWLGTVEDEIAAGTGGSRRAEPFAVETELSETAEEWPDWLNTLEGSEPKLVAERGLAELEALELDLDDSELLLPAADDDDDLDWLKAMEENQAGDVSFADIEAGLVETGIDEPITAEAVPAVTAVDEDEWPAWLRAMEPAEDTPPADSQAESGGEEWSQWLGNEAEAGAALVTIMGAAGQRADEPDSDFTAWSDEDEGIEATAGKDWLTELEQIPELAGDDLGPLPDWLRGEGSMAEVPAAKIPTDWVGQETGVTGKVAEEQMIDEPEKSQGGVPQGGVPQDGDDFDDAMAWLENLAAQQGAPLEELPTVMQSGSSPAGETATGDEDLPDWLKMDLQQGGMTDADVDTWLKSGEAGGEAADWLDLASPAAAVADDQTWLATGPAEQTDEMPDWLRAQMPADLAQPAAISPTSRAEDDLGWLDQIGSAAALEEQPTLSWDEPAEEEVSFGELAATFDQEEEPLDWLAELDEPVSAAPAEALPDFAEASEPVSGFDMVEDSDEAMAWLEQLAAQQGAPLEELPTVSRAAMPADTEAITADLLAFDDSDDFDFFGDLKTEDFQAEAEPQPAGTEDEALTWLEGLSAGPDMSPADLPELEAGSPFDEMPELDTPFLTPLESESLELGDDWMVEPAPSVDAGTKVIVAEADLFDQIPEEGDDAMAWLEQLAAQQGAPLEELPSLSGVGAVAPLDEVEVEPLWAAEPAGEMEMEMGWLAADLVEDDLVEDNLVEANLAFEAPTDEDEAMAWLEQLAAQQGAPLDELPSISREAAEPGLAEAEIEITAADFALEMPEDDDAAMAWLERLAAQQGAPLDELPSVSAADYANIEVTREQPGYFEEELEQPAAVVEAEEVGVGLGIPEDPDEAMAWLEQLAAQQGAPLDELPSVSAADYADIEATRQQPGYFEEELEQPAAVEMEMAWDEVAEPESVADESEPEIEFVTLDSEIPDDPDAALAWLEQLAAEEDDLFAEPMEVVEEPPTPAVPHDVLSARIEAEASLQPPAAADSGFGFAEDEMPEDPEAAMAWLEQLAARQGAPLDELKSVDVMPAEADVSMPSWVAREMAEAPAVVETPDALPEMDLFDAELADILGDDGSIDLLDFDEPAAVESFDFAEPVEAEAEPAAAEPAFDGLDSEGIGESLPDWLSFEPAGAAAGNIDWIDSLVQSDVTGWLSAEEETTSIHEIPAMSTPEPEPTPVRPVAPEPVRVPESRPEPRPTRVEERAPVMESRPAAGLNQSQLAAARNSLSSGDFDTALQDYSGLLDSGAGLNVIIADLESAVTRYSRQPLFTRLLGDAYMRNGQLQKALDMYRRALDQL